jgi:6,7-dimethyl-8-ribityllumazine synthase
MADATIKGLPPPPKSYDGSSHRVLIVHARWNATIIDALVSGAVNKLKEQGVKEENIVIKSVPGSYELPFATKQWVSSTDGTGPLVELMNLLCPLRLISGAQVQSSNSAPSLLNASTTNLVNLLSNEAVSGGASITPTPASGASTGPFTSAIAIGCLIKGSTMHFEYICDAVTHGLMKVQLETGTPVIFGVLTALTDDQALDRAGVGRGPNGKGHS